MGIYKEIAIWIKINYKEPYEFSPKGSGKGYV